MYVNCVKMLGLDEIFSSREVERVPQARGYRAFINGLCSQPRFHPRPKVAQVFFEIAAEINVGSLLPRHRPRAAHDLAQVLHRRELLALIVIVCVERENNVPLTCESGSSRCRVPLVSHHFSKYSRMNWTVA
jgi:hypothetical protein